VRQVERLFNIVAHYRAVLVFERRICAAVPIMPHYVNIAWSNFFGHAFLPDGLAQLFAFGFLPLKIK
jgi:hypothetical protein